METNRPHITPQGFIGVFIVLLGVVFTLDNLGLVKSREVLQYWPLAPIGIGLLIVIHANETRDWVRGTIWLAAGSLLMANNLGWLHFRIEAFWPLLLVFFGLHIIFKARELPEDRLERRADRLRRRQERWRERVERWQERHPGQAHPWSGQGFGGDWGADWTKQWQDKWHEASNRLQDDASRFQDDWQKKWHEKFHREHDMPIDVNVDVPSGGPQNTGTSAGAPGASASAAGAPGGAPASATGGSTTSAQASSGPAAGSSPQSSTTGSTTGSAPFTTGFTTGFASGASTMGYGAGAGAGASGGDGYDNPRSAWGSHRLSMFALMSGVTRRVRNAPFPGANMTAVMGGIELDLRQAQLPEDAVIELFAFWGGIEIWVPRDWSVVNQGFALMGSIEDKTGNLPQRPGQPRLVLRGMALMGGVEIKN